VNYIKAHRGSEMADFVVPAKAGIQYPSYNGWRIMLRTWSSIFGFGFIGFGLVLTLHV